METTATRKRILVEKGARTMEKTNETITFKPLRTSENIDAIALALAKAQGSMIHPQKNKVAKVGSYSYNYSDLADCLDAVRKPFADNEIALVQIAFNPTPTTVGIVTRLMHSSGQWIEGTLYMPTADPRPQTIGSAITYGRRYALGPMAGIASDDDDDGNQAQGQPAETAARLKQRTNPPSGSNERVMNVTQLPERAERMLEKFQSVNISREDLEKKIGKSVLAFGDPEYQTLKDFYSSIANGTKNAEVLSQ